MAELHWMSAFDLAGMIRRRELKPSELVASSLSRIEALNPKFNAFCALRPEEAMAEAHALDEKIARREETGILAGLPLGVKDLEGVAGLAIAGRGRDRRRQNQHAGVRLHPVYEKSAFREDAQSVESRAHARRFLGRQFGGVGRGDGTAYDRFGLGRLDSKPRKLHRVVRAQAVARPNPGRCATRDDGVG